MAQFLNGKNFVVAVSADPLDGITFTSMDVKIVWFTGSGPKLENDEIILNNRCQLTTPDNMVKVDENTFLALVKSEITGKGSIMCNVYARFHDTNFPDDKRKEYIQLPARLFTV